MSEAKNTLTLTIDRDCVRCEGEGILCNSLLCICVAWSEVEPVPEGD